MYPPSVPTIAEQLVAGGPHVEGVPGGHRQLGDRGRDVPAPEIGRARRHRVAPSGRRVRDAPQPVHVLPLGHRRPVVRDNGRRPRRARRATSRSVATTPDYSYITPNLCNDGHDDPCIDGHPGGLARADAWLRDLGAAGSCSSPAYQQDGLLVITFDEVEGRRRDCCCASPAPPNVTQAGITGPGGGRVGALLLSPFATAGNDESRRRTTTTHCCAASKTCSASRTSATRRSRGWPASAPTCTDGARRRRRPVGPGRHRLA